MSQELGFIYLSYVTLTTLNSYFMTVKQTQKRLNTTK